MSTDTVHLNSTKNQSNWVESFRDHKNIEIFMLST